MTRLASLIGSAALVTGCGSGADTGIDPTDVHFGDTALVLVVNPVINDLNLHEVSPPGTVRDGVELTSDDGVTDTTDADGIAVLAPLTPGARTITVRGDGIDASFAISLTAGALREVALAADAGRAQLMVDVDYKTDMVVEVTPEMTNADVNAAIAVSDRVVFVRSGSYAGDLDFAGSRVTLFGEGALGGAVVVDGNVTISGSDSRIRGAHITGDLSIPASGTGVSFSRIDGALAAEGSDTTLLANAMCGSASVTGSGSIVLANAGVAPSASCP